MFHLGPWGKVLAMALGAAAVVLALIIVVCFVGPGCWGYSYLNREEEEQRRRRIRATAARESRQDSLKLTEFPSYKRGSSLYDTVSSAGSLLGRMSHRDSTYSSMSEATDTRSISIQSAVLEEEKVAGLLGPMGPPLITMGLHFSPSSSDAEAPGKLNITVKAVANLPPRDYLGALEPYVELSVVRASWPLYRRASAPLHTFRTRTLRHSYNPRYDQTFTLDARRSELRDWCLRVAVLDHDRLANHTELCTVSIPLREMRQLAEGREVPLSHVLAVSEVTCGEVLLGISYLPTAQRLSFTILRATNLRYLAIASRLEDFHPFVRVLQLSATAGRPVSKKKTTPRHSAASPEFNETLTFDITPHQLESATFLVLVCSRTDGNCNGNGNGNVERRSKELCVGKVALGRLVGGEREREHYLEVMSSIRRVVTMWHSLR